MKSTESTPSPRPHPFMPARGFVIVVTVLLLPVLPGSETHAQIAPGLPVSGGIQSYYQTWRIEDGEVAKDITQIVFPVGLYAPLTDGVELRMATSYVTMQRQFDDSNESESISGLSDLRVQLDAGVLNRHLHLGLLANVPTGKTDLSGQEQDVVLSFIAPDLSVRANRFSQGFNIGATSSYAVEIGRRTVATVGGAFIVRGEYDLTFPGQSSPVSLNPGSELTGTVSVMHMIDGLSIRGVAGYTRHGMEQLDGTDAFRLGPRVFGEAYVAVPFEGEKGRLTFGIQEMYRMSHTSNAGADLEMLMDSDGNYLVTMGGVDYSVSPWLGLSLTGTGRFIGQNSNGVGDARVLDGGLSAVFSPYPVLDITVGGRFIVGSGTGLGGEERTIRGIEGLLRLSARL